MRRFVRAWFVLGAVALLVVACKSSGPVEPSDNAPADNAAPAPADNAAPAPADGPVEVLATYTGWVRVMAFGPDPAPSNQQPRIIRTAEELQSFVAGIPADQPQPTMPAPKNDDALRDAAEIDFATHMLIVATRNSMYVGPKITGVAITAGKLAVAVELPPLGDTVNQQAMLGMGRYAAVLVPRSELEPVFTISDPDND